MFGFGKKTPPPPPPPNGPGSGPDFSDVDSRDKARALADQGVLTPLLLMPEVFGGDAGDHNVLFVPPWAAELKARTDHNIILPLAQDGKITRYSATPAYTGSSVVPISIEISATEPGSFTQTLNIWGPALQDNQAT